MKGLTGSILLLAAMLTIVACAPKGTPVPGATTADLRLQADVTKTIMLYEKARASSCTDLKVVNTGVIEKSTGGGSAV